MRAATFLVAVVLVVGAALGAGGAVAQDGMAPEVVFCGSIPGAEGLGLGTFELIQAEFQEQYGGTLPAWAWFPTERGCVGDYESGAILFDENGTFLGYNDTVVICMPADSGPYAREVTRAEYDAYVASGISFDFADANGLCAGDYNQGPVDVGPDVVSDPVDILPVEPPTDEAQAEVDPATVTEVEIPAAEEAVPGEAPADNTDAETSVAPVAAPASAEAPATESVERAARPATIALPNTGVGTTAGR